MSLKRTVDPTELPISLDELKDHIRDTRTVEDPLLMFYLRSVVDQLDGAAGFLNRALLTQTWEWKIDDFPGWNAYALDYGCLRVPLPPLQSVSSIQYIDTNGDTQTLAASKYNVLDTGNPTRQGRIELAYGETWPSVRDQKDAVTITFVAGFGDRNALPDSIKHLIMVLVAGAACSRMPVSDKTMYETPQVKALMSRATFGGIAP